MQKPIAITLGQPAGIGPDLFLHYMTQPINYPCVVVANKHVLKNRAEKLGLPYNLKAYSPDNNEPLQLLHVECGNPLVCGTPDVSNATHVLKTIDIAAKGCMSGQFSAMVTGPIQKSIINDAGITFSGHTELLAQIAGVDKTVMLLQTDGLRVALATTHLPLAQVSKAITFESLCSSLTILQQDLIQKFSIAEPKIYICGLNPHAGELGHMGREEIDIIEPAIKYLQQSGMSLYGPLPADTIFTEKYLSKADCIFSMYHDQGLPVIKYKGFGKTVNITLGLPFIRTSVDHGTALEIAGTGKADPSSFLYAIDVAKSLI